MTNDMKREDFKELVRQFGAMAVNAGRPYFANGAIALGAVHPLDAKGKENAADAVMAAWDAQAAELERERMRLAVCGVVALADTPESAARARDMLPTYWSASCGDVARMVDTLMALRFKLGMREAEVGQLRAALLLTKPEPTGVPLTAENAPRARVVEFADGDVARVTLAGNWRSVAKPNLIWTTEDAVDCGAVVLAWRVQP